MSCLLFEMSIKGMTLCVCRLVCEQSQTFKLRKISLKNETDSSS